MHRPQTLKFCVKATPSRRLYTMHLSALRIEYNSLALRPPHLCVSKISAQSGFYLIHLGYSTAIAYLNRDFPLMEIEGIDFTQIWA